MRTGASLRAKKSAGPRADGFFTLRSARGIFVDVHAAAENDFNYFAAKRRNSARLFRQTNLLLDVADAVVAVNEAAEVFEAGGGLLRRLGEALLHLLEHVFRAHEHGVGRAALPAGGLEVAEVEAHKLELGLDALGEVLIPAELRNAGEGDAVKINLDQPMSEILKELTKYPVSTRLSLNGTIIVARDIAHAKIKERLDRGEEMPQYLKDHPVYYAGPAKTPAGMACGSMGPTTAGRMDPYVDLFQSHGGSMVMLAKGNRSQQVTDACRKHGGFYLGSIGGPAAILARNNIKSIECVEYPELGMEAIWKIRVEDFPAFILVDDKGNDFFKTVLK